MKADANTRIYLRTPLTAAALSLLLVACGGGGSDGGSRNVSASPSAGSSGTSAAAANAGATSSAGATTNIVITPGTTGAIADAITGGTPSNTGTGSNTGSTGTGGTSNTGSNAGATGNGTAAAPNGGSAASGATGTGSTGSGNTADAGAAAGSNTGNGAGTTTAPTTPAVVPLVSDQGVRGDVLLAMFDQHACQGEFSVSRAESLTGPHLSQDTAIKNDTPPVYSTATLDAHAYTYDYNKWREHGSSTPSRVPGYVLNCHYPDIRSYSNPVKPGSYTFQMTTEGRYHTYLTMRYYGDPSITKGVNEVQAKYPLTVTTDQFSVGGEAKVELEEDFGYQAKDISGQGVPDGRDIDLTLAGTARSYQRQGLVPFGAINQWQDGAGNNLQLLLIKADEPNTIRLCTHINSVLAKRLHCVTWQVPTDWAWGKELVGGKHYLIDDRTVYAVETGFFYWH